MSKALEYNPSEAGMSHPKKVRANHYNDPKHNYLRYWRGREYEHLAEEMAIKRLLKGKHFEKAVDIGGGYGRLSVLLKTYADEVTLAEPSEQQLDLAETFLKDYPDIKRMHVQADDLQLADGSIDLITMIRVLHHLPDPRPEFREIARVLSDHGLAIIEVANYLHFRNRLKYTLKGKKFSASPIDIRSEHNQTDTEIPFVNHHPDTVVRQLSEVGLKVHEVLSVSNLRSPRLKKVLPSFLMLSLEKAAQGKLARIYFGPSIFFLVHKRS